jgi:hypothetical protein
LVAIASFAGFAVRMQLHMWLVLPMYYWRRGGMSTDLLGQQKRAPPTSVQVSRFKWIENDCKF